MDAGQRERQGVDGARGHNSRSLAVRRGEGATRTQAGSAERSAGCRGGGSRRANSDRELSASEMQAGRERTDLSFRIAWLANGQRDPRCRESGEWNGSEDD